MKNILFLVSCSLLTALISTGCGGGGYLAPQTTGSSHKGKITDSRTGSSVDGVSVTLFSNTSTTDESGNYSFYNISQSREATVSFKKQGYLPKSIRIQIKAKAADGTALDNFTEQTIRKHTWSWEFTTQDGKEGSVVNIPSAAQYTDKDHHSYQGVIKAYASRLKGEELRNNFPGSFKGIDSNGEEVLFRAYGMVSAALYDNSGDRVDLSSGESGEYIFEVARNATTSDTLPLWLYNEDTGIWTEEGTAYRQDNGTYRATVSQIGTWSICEPIETEAGIYRGHISYPDGRPASAIRVYAQGDDWIEADISTDENGDFEIHVVPNRSFRLKVYDYQYKYSAAYNGVIPAIDSGDVVEEEIQQ